MTCVDVIDIKLHVSTCNSNVHYVLSSDLLVQSNISASYQQKKS